MSSYTHFTEEEKEQARNTDLVSAIGFVQRYGNLTFPEAVSCLLSEQGIVIRAQQRVTVQKEKSPLPFQKSVPICDGCMPIY